MVDPVSLNIPGLPYFLFALGFFVVVVLLAGVLAPIEAVIRRPRQDRRSDAEDGE